MSAVPSIQIVDDGRQYNYQAEITIHLNNVQPALANSLRRVMLSEIPNVAFDQTSHDDVNKNHIKIGKNTSAIHNEFLAHRVALVPICTYQSGRLNILSTFNKNTCERVLAFRVAQETPTFSLKVENNEETREHYKQHRKDDIEKDDNIILVTTYDLEITSPKDPDEVRNFIRPDIVTEKSQKKLTKGDEYKNYIILNKLKVGSSGKGEGLSIQCHPAVGTGEINAIYSPVGTVSYKFLPEDSAIQEEVFKYYLDNLTTERENKGLKAFDEQEVSEIKKSYQYLDAKRVYKRDQKGNANAIELCIESIGGMLPVQIFHNSLKVLCWKIRDILTCIVAECPNPNTLRYHLLSKVEINDSPTKMEAFEIKINNENHTIGNLVTKYLQDLYLGNILDFVSYQKPHPLENNIIIRLKLSPKLDHQKFLRWLGQNKELVDENLSSCLEKLNVQMVNQGSDNVDSEVETTKFISIFMMVQGFNAALKTLLKMDSDWERQTSKISETVKNNNFLMFSHPESIKSWYPRVDLMVSPEQFNQVAIYEKIASNLSNFQS